MVEYRRHIRCLFYMETRKKMKKSSRKFVRSQKAQIRSQFSDIKKQAEAIKEMYNKISPADQNKNYENK